MISGLIENAKLIAETVTAISAAIIVLGQALKFVPKPMREFFTKTVPMFFCGVTTAAGEKLRFIRAVKAYRAQQAQFQNIVKALTDFETDEVFVLNPSRLFTFLSESKLFTKVTRRKQ